MVNMNNFSNKIIQIIKGMIDEQIIICDTDSLIIASTDASRIGRYHEGAKQVVENKQPLIINKQLVKKLQGVKTGINLPLYFNETVIAVIGITGDIEKVKPFGEIIRKMTELLINESYYTEQLELERRTIEAFVFEWLYNKTANENLKDQAKTLNISMDGKKQGVIISFDKEKSMIQNGIWEYVKQYIPKRDILVRWGNNRLFWIHDASKSSFIKTTVLKEIKRKCEEYFCVKLQISIGQVVVSSEIYQSYEQALIALKYSSSNESIRFYSELYLELCLQDISMQTKRDLVKRTIYKLERNPSLLTTLKVFIREELSYQQAASKLFVHINTLHYRLSRIEEITQFNPRKFSDLIVLYLAILFLKETTKK